MEATLPTLRAHALDAMLDEVEETAKREHQRNYHRLHVRRDGTVRWFEAVDQHSDIIDDHADHFCAVESVCRVGTGSYECNCDYCQDGGYDSTGDAIADAVANSDLDGLRDQMIAAFSAIAVGYFDDEEDEA